MRATGAHFSGCGQVEIPRRLRQGGQQIFRVEHVHVNDGGQAFIGNVKKEEAKA